MSNFNSCIFEPPQPIPSHFIGVPASFSHSYFFLPNIFFDMYFWYIFIYLFFSFFCGETQKWVTTLSFGLFGSENFLPSNEEKKARVFWIYLFYFHICYFKSLIFILRYHIHKVSRLIFLNCFSSHHIIKNFFFPCVDCFLVYKKSYILKLRIQNIFFVKKYNEIQIRSSSHIIRKKKLIWREDRAIIFFIRKVK